MTFSPRWISWIFIIYMLTVNSWCAVVAQDEKPAKSGESSINVNADERIRELEEKLRLLQQELQELKEQQQRLEEERQRPVEPRPSYQPSGPAADALMNPRISTIADFVWQVNHNRDIDGGNPFNLREVEVALQSNIDPFSKADIFLSLEGTEMHAEEAYATLFRLPLGFQGKVGAFRASLGKNSTLHRHEWLSVDNPNVLENFIGEEGLKGTGISLMKNFSIGGAYGELTLEALNDENNIAFSGGSSGRPIYSGKLRTYFDFSDTANLDLGLSHAVGYRDAEAQYISRISAIDATFRWRPAEAGIYRSLLVRGEAFQNQSQIPDADDNYARGYYILGNYQMGRNWYLGARYDYSEFPRQPGLSEKAWSGILTFFPSEYMMYRLQYKNLLGTGVRDRHEVWLQMLFSIGPHGAHKF